MSLLQRVNNGRGALQNTNNNNNNQNNGRGNRFPGRNNNNQNSNNNQNNTPPPDPNTYLVNVKVPQHTTVVQFSMAGLGDPFYRILGMDMDPAMGDPKALAAALAAGGAQVDALVERLDAEWGSYELCGAALVYIVNRNLQAALAKPAPVPQNPQVPDWLEDTAQGQDGQSNDRAENSANPLAVTVLRATDPALTLNVLGRARTQLLIASAPLVFGYEYIVRGIACDDPRLVALARATGCIELTA
jgi:hypothetical protein